jgi:hypothetical protein
MRKQLLAVTILFLALSSVNVVFGSVAVGVKAGDWVEYTVTTTGVPGEGHNVVWARMEIRSIAHSEITVNTTTKAENGTYSSIIMTLDPSVGAVDVWAIIPANLSEGDSFYDRNFGNILIQDEEKRTFFGVSRDTTFYNSTERFKRWDKATGVFLEGTDRQSNFTLTATLHKTNLWSHQILEIEPTVFLELALAISVGILLLIVTFLFVRSRGSKLNPTGERHA